MKACACALILLTLSLEAAPAHAASAQPYSNHLVHEKSPYLLLHAHNPVDWYPWGELAFRKARRENKPIFLSVGYYTCHWCHVMERESYSNAKIAALLNRSFIAVKVDREERPDVDDTYMAFLEATNGRGGWPMNVFLTPDLKPFAGGTYFSPEELEEMLPRIAELWRTQGSETERSAQKIVAEMRRESMLKSSAELPGPAVLDLTFDQIKQTYDPQNRGFGSAPKFPRPAVIEFLFRYWKRTGNKEALEMALSTLRAMSAGGVHDQLGGGFHRYATDAQWRVPHFEKMLPDQAQLATAYTEAFQITHDPLYAETAKDILDFTLREMRDPSGGFYSALDADSSLSQKTSAKGEGAFYTWTAGEIERVLGPDTAPIFEYRYGVSKNGRNVLFQEHTIEETAARFGRTPEGTRAFLTDAAAKLRLVRVQRPRPPADTKIITAWNGMMISALAQASQVFNQPEYLRAAQQSEELIHRKLYQAQTKTLKRRFRDGNADIDGYLSDYAWTVKAALDLYEASFDVTLLPWAIEVQTQQDRLFWDASDGGYFDTTAADRSILWRSKEAEDGAEPSGNSVSVLNLLWLWQLTDGRAWKDKADKTLAVFSGKLKKEPEQIPLMSAALDDDTAQHKQIVIAGAPADKTTGELLTLVRQKYLPNSVLFFADGGKSQKELSEYLAVAANMKPRNGMATAYICEDYVCNLPTSDPDVAARLLEGSK